MIWFEVVRVLRRLRRVPRFSAFVIVSIGIAVAPILVASSVFEAAFLRDMTVKVQGQLFSIRSARNAGGNSTTPARGMSFPDYQDLRAALPGGSWRNMTAWKLEDVNRATTGGDRPLRIAAISGDYFRIANAHFVRGYWPADQEIGVVVTQALWRELAGGRETAYLTIYNQHYRITGVVDDSFRGLYPSEGIEAWISLAALPRLEGDLGLLTYRELEDLSVVVETVADGGTPSVRPEVLAISTHLSEFHGANRHAWHLEVTPAQPAFLELLHTARGQVALAPILVLVCLLLIAATTVGNLFAVRAAARESERQLQVALGVPRRYLLLYECLEPIALGSAGLILGLWTGTLMLQYVAAVPALERLRLQPSAASAIAACGAAVLFAGTCALIPAVRLGRLREAGIIHQGYGITSHGVSRLQWSFLVFQFTLALAFTSIAIQLAFAVRQQSAVDVGFDTRSLYVITDIDGAPGRTPEQWLDDYDRVAAAVSSIQGVASVSASVSEFFGGYRMTPRLISALPTTGPSSNDDRVAAVMDVVGPAYFATLGLPVHAGREFSNVDGRGVPARILVNQTLAKIVAGGGEPIGMTLYESGTYPVEIIGVVPDIRTTAAEQVQPVFYRAISQSPLPSFVMYVRAGAISPSFASAITQAIVKQLPESAGRLQIHTASEQRRQRDLPALAVFWLSTGLAILTMLIAGFGLYGIASYTILARRREHGIRAALGASPRQLVTLVVSEGLGWTAVAAAMSLPFVWVGMKLAATLVVGVRPIPILGIAVLIAAYFLVASLALTVPALRAASVSPSRVLKSL